MNDNEIIAKLERIINETLGYEIVLEKDTKLNELGASSFAIIQLICAVEDEFGISIPNTVLKNINNVSKLIKYIKKQNLN